MAATNLQPRHGITSVELIPWDPNSPEHVERLRLQRVACGWKEDRVEGWRKFQREGKLVYYWIVPAPEHFDRSNMIQQHLNIFPREHAVLHDSCRLVLGEEREPTQSAFLPVGHICLDGCVENHENNRLMISRENGVYTISTFYISKALQGLGLGGVAMSALEKVAVSQVRARTLTLDTLSNEDCGPGSPRMIALSRPATKVAVSDWYQRRGYVVYDVVRDAVVDVDPTGKLWPSTLLFMKKDLA